MSFYFAIIGLACLAAAGQAGPTADRRVTREAVEITDVPYIAQIRNDKGALICSGAIMNSLYILTTASCVYDLEANNLTVVVGSSNLNSGTEYSVRAIIPHVDYGSMDEDEDSLNDIAMIKVSKYLRYSTSVRPIALPEPYYEEEVEDGSVVTVSGWSESSSLRKITQVVANLRECKEAYRDSGKEITAAFICTEPHATDECEHGNNGSPLVKNSKLVGLMSWGIEGKPDVYSLIYPNLEWIDENNTDY